MKRPGFARVGAALRQLDERGWLRGECVLGLPGHLTSSRLLRVPRVADRQRRRIIELNGAGKVRCGRGDDLEAQSTVAEVDDGHELVLSAAKRRIIERLTAEVRAVGLLPGAVLPAWLGLALGRSPSSMEAERWSFPWGRGPTHLILQSSARSLVHTVALGGNLVTQALAARDWSWICRRRRRSDAGVLGCPVSEEDRRERKAFECALDELSGGLRGDPAFPAAGPGRRGNPAVRRLYS